MHGALAGTALSARRLLRCNPWCAGGHDPVPPAIRPLNREEPGRTLMDNNRLILAVALSIAILVGFELVLPKQNRQALHQQAAHTTQTTPPGAAPAPQIDTASAGTQPVAIPSPLSAGKANDQRIPIDAPRLKGSVNLTGARLDDVVLRDYRETIQANSPQVRVLEPRSSPQPNLVQVGWSAAPDSTVKLPDSDTRWTTDGHGPVAGQPADAELEQRRRTDLPRRVQASTATSCSASNSRCRTPPGAAGHAVSVGAGEPWPTPRR